MEYTLYENKLTTEIDDDYVARLVNVETKTREDVVAEITGPGSILKSTECNAVLTAYWEKIASMVQNGAYYRDKYLTIRMNVVGSFMGENDRFDADRHELKVNIHPLQAMNDSIIGMSLQYVKPELVLPILEDVYDWGSNTTNQKLTPNDTLEISGENLKVYTEDDNQGIYFLNVGDGSETKAELVRTSTPKTLTLRVPTISAGSYRIEVRNAGRNSSNLRVGISNFALTVE